MPFTLQDLPVNSKTVPISPEKAISRIINELYRKGADVVYEKSEGLHVSGHACQEELKIIHALTKPRFFVPLHGEQRMLQIHCHTYTSPAGTELADSFMDLPVIPG